MKKRYLLSALVAVLVIAAMLLPACGEEEATPAPTAAPTGTATPAKTSVPLPSPTVQQAAKVYKWKLQGLPSPGTWSFEHGIAEWCRKVNFLTDGQMECSAYGPGGIVPFDETMSAVQTGTLEAAQWWTCYDMGMRPVTAFFGTVPFGFESNQDYNDWWWDYGGKELMNECYNEWGIVVPWGASTSPAQIAGQMKKQYNSYQEMGGLIFRSSGLQAEVLQNSGMEVIFLPAAELFTAIERGVIDVVEYGSPNWNYLSAYHEVAPHIIGPGWHEPASFGALLVNEDRWNELPEDLQIKIVAAGDWYARVLGSETRVLDLEAMDKLADYGCTFTRLPDRDLQILYDNWVELCETKSAEDDLFARVWDSICEYKERMAPLRKFVWDFSFERSEQPLPKIVTEKASWE